MKLSSLKHWINQYDTNKGFGRRLFGTWAEPSIIFNIRGLIEDIDKQIPDGEDPDSHVLSTSNLLRLATILARTDIVSGHESATIAESIARTLGGIATLKILHEKNALNLDNIYLLEKTISTSMDYSTALTNQFCTNLISLNHLIKGWPQRDKFMKCLTTTPVPFGIHLYLDVLVLLCSVTRPGASSSSAMLETIDPKLKVPELTPTLLTTVSPSKLDSISNIISCLLRYNRSLLTYENMIRIFNLTETTKFLTIIRSLAIDQEQFDRLTIKDIRFNECRWFNQICLIFCQNHWDIVPVLKILVTEKIYENQLFFDISQLAALNISLPFIPEILSAITNQPQYSSNFINVISIMVDARLLDKSNINLLVNKFYYKPELLPEFLRALHIIKENNKLEQSAFESLICNDPTSVFEALGISLLTPAISSSHSEPAKPGSSSASAFGLFPTETNPWLTLQAGAAESLNERPRIQMDH